MSKCLHGYAHGYGCPKCPKIKQGEKSEEKKALMRATVLIMKRATAEKDPAKKAIMEGDFITLDKMQRRY